MQLSLHADYALRALIYLGTRQGEVVSTQQISDAYGISKHHLVRVVQTLAEHGYVELLPGRSGGIRLIRDPATVRLGDLVRRAEPSLRLAECFDRETNTCPIVDSCGLTAYLHDALRAFLTTLNAHTLSDLLTKSRRSKLATVFLQVQRRASAAPKKDA